MRNTRAVPYTAAGAVTPNRIVKFGANAGEVTNSAAAADKHIGVADNLGADAQGKRCEIFVGGIVPVEYGGAVTQGDPLTSDAVGRAVVAAPAAGVNVRIIGFAHITGVLGDIGEADLSPGFMQG